MRTLLDVLGSRAIMTFLRPGKEDTGYGAEKFSSIRCQSPVNVPANV